MSSKNTNKFHIDALPKMGMTTRVHQKFSWINDMPIANMLTYKTSLYA